MRRRSPLDSLNVLYRALKFSLRLLTLSMKFRALTSCLWIRAISSESAFTNVRRPSTMESGVVSVVYSRFLAVRSIRSLHDQLLDYMQERQNSRRLSTAITNLNYACLSDHMNLDRNMARCIAAPSCIPLTEHLVEDPDSIKAVVKQMLTCALFRLK